MMSTPEQSQEGGNSSSEIALDPYASGTVGPVLQRVVALAVKTIAGCDACGILFLKNPERTARAFRNPILADVDTMQIRVGQGPCLDAVAQGGTIYAADLADDPRWPAFAPMATEAGVRSLLAFRLSAERTIAVGLYAHVPGTFGASELAAGLTFATLAGVAVTAALDREEDRRRADNLQEAMRSREVIGQAQGILMERERITADQAFDRLRQASQRLNVKLRDVADSLVETGEVPDAQRWARPDGARYIADGTSSGDRPGAPGKS
jgi:GAF domain-containing protein